MSATDETLPSSAVDFIWQQIEALHVPAIDTEIYHCVCAYMLHQRINVEMTHRKQTVDVSQTSHEPSRASSSSSPPSSSSSSSNIPIVEHMYSSLVTTPWFDIQMNASHAQRDLFPWVEINPPIIQTPLFYRPPHIQRPHIIVPCAEKNIRVRSTMDQLHPYAQ